MQKINLNCFFSTEDYSEVIVTQDEAKNLSYLFDKFYKSNLVIFKKVFNQIFSYKFQEILINRAISPITYIFFERFLRAYKFHRIRNGIYKVDKNSLDSNTLLKKLKYYQAFPFNTAQ